MCTGRRSNCPFFSSLTESLELPRLVSESPSSDSENQVWGDLLSRFLQFAHPTPHQKRLSTPTTTAKVYNGIAPTDPNPAGFIVLLDHIDISNSFRAAEAQAIWSTAYSSGHLAFSALAEMQQRVAYMKASSRRRYPSHSQKRDCIFSDWYVIRYTDYLLAEIGLILHRAN